MDLLILDGTREDWLPARLHYRGTYRKRPTYCDAFDEAHPLNRAFLWYVEAGGESGIVHDLVKALDLVKIYKAYGLGERLEVVEVTRGDAQAEAGGQMLGYDLSSKFGYSLLGPHPTITNTEKLASSERDLGELVPLVTLVNLETERNLNSKGLLTDLGKATFLLGCYKALLNLWPNLDEPLEYEVTGVFALPMRTP